MLARLAVVFLVAGAALTARGNTDKTYYYVYVALESEDTVVLLEFDGSAISEVARFEVGYMPGETEGPHGLALSPDGAHLFVSMAHGNPFGTVLKIRTDTHRQIGSVELGLFPATMAISPETGMLFVSNFNLHGDAETSSVSIVDPDKMIEIERIETGVMPHGGRFGPDGRTHYSVSMMDGKLHSIDAARLVLNQSLTLPPGDLPESRSKPTWVSPHPDGDRVFVADNRNDRVLEISLRSERTIRFFETPAGPYNLDVSSDGSLFAATYKSAGSTGIWRLSDGSELARVANSAPIPHGVVFAPDDRYVFVTTEGVGSTSGTLDIVGLEEGALLASMEIGSQPGGIVFWKATDVPDVRSPSN